MKSAMSKCGMEEKDSEDEKSKDLRGKAGYSCGAWGNVRNWSEEDTC